LKPGDTIPLFAVSGTGAFANAPGFGSVSGPTLTSGLTADKSQLTGGPGGNIVIGGNYVPSLSFTTAPGMARFITMSDLNSAGLASSQNSPNYTFTAAGTPSAGGSSASVVASGAMIKYTSLSSASGIDVFTYTVSDGTSSGTANVTNTFASVAGPSIGNPGTDGSGHPQFTFHGIPGYTYHIQRSPDLATWTTLEPGLTIVNSDGSYTYTDTSGTVPSPNVYYRLSYP
jgi:hypothetical protein